MDKLTIGAFSCLFLTGVWSGGALFWICNQKTKKWTAIGARLVSLSIPPQFIRKMTLRDLNGFESKKFSVTYHYQYEKQEFESSALTISDTFLMPASIFMLARRLEDSWKTTREIEIYFDPEQPHRSFVTKRVALWPFFVLTPIGIGFPLFVLLK